MQTTQFIACNNCGIEKPINQFYPRNRVCKACTIERVAKYQKGQGLEVHRKAGRKYATGNGRELNRERADRFHAEHPKQDKARKMVHDALKSRRMTKGPCEVCGAVSVHGHHDDYDKPLKVRWLCPEHHAEWHKINGKGLNGDL